VKVGLSELESARANPTGFARRRIEGSTGRPSLSRIRTVHLAAWRFHKGVRQDEVLEQFESMFRRNFTRLEMLPGLSDQLDHYMRGFAASGTTVIEAPVRRVQIPMPEGSIITGELSRLDLADHGRYAAWVFLEAPHGWREELRMPLLQAAIADRLGVDPSAVSIGTYSFSLRLYDTAVFSRQQIRQAQLEASQLVRRLSELGVV
jgi:hypothetical protein